MFHITVWKSPDLTVIISLLSLPASPSSSLHLWPFSSSSFPPFYPPLCILPCTPRSEWFLLPSSSAETMFETWYCLSGSIRLVAVRGPLCSPSGPDTPHLLSDADVSHVGFISPLFFFSLPFPISAPLFLSIFYSLSFFLPLLTSRFFLVSWTCSVPSLHRWLNVIRQAYSPSNSMCATIIPHPV